MPVSTAAKPKLFMWSALALCFAAPAIWWFRRPAPPLAFRPIAGPRGAIRNARFYRNGSAVVAGISAEDGSYRIYAGAPTSSLAPTAISDAELLAVAGDRIAAATGFRRANLFSGWGSLAVGSLQGHLAAAGADQVRWADWNAGATRLAIVTGPPRAVTLQSPPGTVLLHATPGGSFSYPRFSPDGRQIAFFENPTVGEKSAALAVIDLNGNKRLLTRLYPDSTGVAWNPRSNAIWFATGTQLREIVPGNSERLVAEFPSTVTLHDIDSQGRLLLTVDRIRGAVVWHEPGGSDRRLTGLTWPQAGPLSADGRTLVIQHRPAGQPVIARLHLPGTTEVLGAGHPTALSPDGRWLAVRPDDGLRNPGLELVPAAGSTRRRVELPGVLLSGAFLPGTDLLLSTYRQGGPVQTWIQPAVEGAPAGSPKLILHGFRSGPLRPDGSRFLCYDSATYLCRVDGGPPEPLNALLPDDQPIGWSNDGHSLYVARQRTSPLQIERVDVATGRREAWRTFPSELPQATVSGVSINPAATAWSYHARVLDSELVIADRLP